MRIHYGELEPEAFANSEPPQKDSAWRPGEKIRGRGELQLGHLDRMTDSTGLIQHAIYSVPRRESGYTTDDNARALRLCARLWGLGPDRRLLDRVTIYLSFLEHARCPVRGFHNFLSYQRDWLDSGGTGDCQGQAVLALAEVLASRLPRGYRALARELIEAVLPALAELRSLRAQAYVIVAWGHLRSAETVGMEPLERIAASAARRLMSCFQRSVRPDWPWFEARLTYANAVLPQALLVAAQCWPQEAYLDVAETSFSFLDRVTTSQGVFWPVGNSDWYSHGEPKSLYDQQPVEAATMADAALAAFDVTGDEKHLLTFRRARGWFRGENSLGLSLADVEGGGCCDGLQPAGVNANQGAESTLSWLWTELQALPLSRADGETARPAIGEQSLE